jgi:hypothetical protein
MNSTAGKESIAADVAIAAQAVVQELQQQPMITRKIRGRIQRDLTMMPEVFPARTEFANVKGIPVSCNDHGMCRAWDTEPDRKFPISALIIDGIFITEAAFRELARKVNLKGP